MQEAAVESLTGEPGAQVGGSLAPTQGQGTSADKEPKERETEQNEWDCVGDFETQIPEDYDSDYMPSLVWDHKDTELLPEVPYIPMDRDIAGLHRKLDEAPEKADRRLEDTIRSTTDVATATAATREEVKKKYADLLERVRKLDRSPTPTRPKYGTNALPSPSRRSLIVSRARRRRKFERVPYTICECLRTSRLRASSNTKHCLTSTTTWFERACTG